MQERFRFRLWCEKCKVYTAPIDITIDADGYMRTGHVLMNVGDTDHSESMTIEQCTGHRDCTGRLIYEGDVVREMERDWMQDGKWVPRDYGKTMAISAEMDFNCGCCNSVYGWEIPSIDDDFYHVEIIGNVHTETQP